MKFTDILKTIGLGNTNGNSFIRNTTAGQLTKNNPEADVDRIFHGYQNQQQQQQQQHQQQQHYQMHNPYHHQMDLQAASPAIGNFYYPATYNTYGQRGFGLKLGGAGHAHGAGGYDSGMGHHHGVTGAGGHGYEQTGYGGGYGGGAGYAGDGHGGGGGGFDYGHSTPRHKSKGSSVMTALTLMSFFFFINLLQSCLKEHMEAMNPTVMVMTAGVSRTRLNKLTEKIKTDSREESNANRDDRISSHNTHENDGYSYPNITRSGIKIKSKLKNDFYRNGESIFTRIN